MKIGPFGGSGGYPFEANDNRGRINHIDMQTGGCNHTDNIAINKDLDENSIHFGGCAGKSCHFDVPAYDYINHVEVWCVFKSPNAPALIF